MNRKGKLFRTLGVTSVAGASMLMMATMSSASSSGSNAKGGLLGHKVVLDIKSDASDATQVVTNYKALISVDHVNLTFGPFSTLLTLPSAQTVNRYGYAMIEGAGGGPSIFQAGLKNVFDVTLPVSYDLAPFSKWLTSLPKSSRPTTIAYATSNDPFTQPVVQQAQKLIGSS